MRMLLWFCLAITTGVYICGPIIDPDLWWHITFGKWILAHQSIPTTDHWNMWGVGKPWRAYSWLPEIILALVDNNFGPQGLITLKLILSISLALCLFYTFSRLASDWFLGALLGVWVTAGCFNHFTLRPQVLVWIYFALILLLADRIERHGLKPRYFVGIFALMALWANTHLSAVIGLFALGMWLWSRARLTVTVQVLLVAFAGTLVTPYFGGEWLTLISKSGHPFQHNMISEFKSATIMQHSTAFVLILLAVVLAFWHYKPNSTSLAKLLLIFILTVAGLAIVKFLPFALIAIAAIIANIWSNERGSAVALGNLAEALQRFKALVAKIPSEGLCFLLICIAIVYSVSVWRQPIDKRIVPVDALDFIINQKTPFPLLNDFGRGGYVMYRLSDAQGNLEHLVPIDGRTNVTPPDVFNKFIATLNGKQNWRDFINLVNPQTILWPNDSALIALLLLSGEWCQVFQNLTEDSGYSVFVKQTVWQQRQSELPSMNCKN